MTNKLDEIPAKRSNYFTEKLEQHGTIANGADSNSEQAREIRFAELCDLQEGINYIDTQSTPFYIRDIPMRVTFNLSIYVTCSAFSSFILTTDF